MIHFNNKGKRPAYDDIIQANSFAFRLSYLISPCFFFSPKQSTLTPHVNANAPGQQHHHSTYIFLFSFPVSPALCLNGEVGRV